MNFHGENVLLRQENQFNVLCVGLVVVKILLTAFSQFKSLVYVVGLVWYQSRNKIDDAVDL